ncbi:MAG: AAA family ATPase [Caulobacteraceae bacterium]
MSRLHLKRARVLAAGDELFAVMREALPDAALEGGALASAVTAQVSFDLVAIDADRLDPGEVTMALMAFAAARRPPAVLLIGERLGAAVFRALMQIPHSDVLEPPYTPEDLTRAADALLLKAAMPEAAPLAPQNSHCWAITGAVGGAGATTLAVETAAVLAVRKPPGRVALVDLNLADGAAAAYLGASANMALAEASLTPERIDAALLSAFAVEAAPYLDLFAAPRSPTAFAATGAEGVCRLLEAACQAYEYVIVDLPRVRQPWTVEVLNGADEVVVISELTVPALLAARSLASEIDAELDAGRSCRIIFNRLSNRMFGPAPSLTEAEKALGRKADGGVTSDWEAAACSVNLGGPIGHHRPRSKIVKDVAAIADRLIAGAAGHGSRKVA